ncbi:MAG: hypothetical protein ACT4SY_09145 [Hyphomicrobiales bacterium]
MRLVTGLFAVAAWAAASSAARAEDCAAPCLGYAFSSEFQGDWIVRSNPSSNQSYDLQLAADWEIYLALTEEMKLVTAIASEPVKDRAPGEDRIFADLGTFVEKLYAEFDLEPLTVKLGKFEPVQGWASPELNGIHATDLAGNLDTEERWGVETGFAFAAAGLDHLLTASLFSIDRTALSESIFTNRGRTALSDGGAGNTKGISSLALYLSGCAEAEPEDCYSEGSYGYRLGFRYQKAGRATQEQIDLGITPDDEVGIVADAIRSVRLDSDMTLRLLGEAANLRDFEDGDGDALIATLSAALDRGPWTYEATYSQQRNFSSKAEGGNTGHLADVTAIYRFGEDATFFGEAWQAAAGYSYSRDAEGETVHTIALKVTVDYAGSVPLGP